MKIMKMPYNIFLDIVEKLGTIRNSGRLHYLVTLISVKQLSRGIPGK